MKELHMNKPDYVQWSKITPDLRSFVYGLLEERIRGVAHTLNCNEYVICIYVICEAVHDCFNSLCTIMLHLCGTKDNI